MGLRMCHSSRSRNDVTRDSAKANVNCHAGMSFRHCVIIIVLLLFTYGSVLFIHMIACTVFIIYTISTLFAVSRFGILVRSAMSVPTQRHVLCNRSVFHQNRCRS